MFAKLFYPYTLICVNAKISQSGYTVKHRTLMRASTGWIWNRIPKTNHVGRDILSFTVYDAIAHYNVGGLDAYSIFK